MPVLENLKNFIRHGKQAIAYDDYGSEPTVEAGAVISPETEYIEKKENFGEAIARIVAEENELKSKLPTYPGLERWVLLEKMGDGAFSNVYKAQSKDTGELAAIKVVRKYDITSAESHRHHLGEEAKKQQKTVDKQRSSILKEVSILRQIDHPNVVSLIDFFESDSYYYIIMELLPGGELFHQIVRLTYFSEDLSRHVIVQVAEALKYLHEELGIVHRDIKPENILFYPIKFIPSKEIKLRPGDEDKVDEGQFIPGVGAGGIGKIKIADFGLSKVVWDSQTMTPCGTVGYTAPEIVKDERYSKSVDMWALGCVLYTLLCGFPPFYDESIQSLTEKVARGQYTFLSPWWDPISKCAKDLVSHLLTVDPERRYTIEQFLNHPWITQSNAPTAPAFDAPPTIDLASPMMDILETPRAAARDNPSPAVNTLKEAFDISYAVHRMEEERARKQGGAQNLGMLNEEEEEEEEEFSSSSSGERLQQVEAGLRNVHMSPINHRHKNYHVSGQKGAHHSTANHKRKGKFELSLNGATLLERRRERQQQQHFAKAPIVVS
ncbi:kinase-like domain-containing protein [Lipomyces tetrasporus]|uniref:Kinase-like domain-containing protein n=1 Tax=Lipomyces tetrasporus TaxID=54092 RepID=A0AAD7VUT2_9ASCO|nr:kinase-like domain-containing protein [Lipomyces tetrasporus]KAJ8102803.1 kinase-like domain-containing protein [Lipomyces tetrasporus]